jgi:CIC family chloride channel protein
MREAVEESGDLSIRRWVVLGFVLGVVAGLGAVVLQFGIDSVNRLALCGLGGLCPPGLPSEGGQLVQAYLPSYRWWLLLLVPTLGGLATGLIVYTLAPEAEGHGTDAVIRAFHREGGYIRARVPIVKIIASAITLGTGGSGGREGPIAQIGSGFGSWLATLLRLSDSERRIMLIAGAAGGIGAIFRAPLGGALVICELLYRNAEFEHQAIVPSLLTSVVAYSVYSLIHGWAPMFQTSGNIFEHPESLLVYFVLGVVLAALGWCYVKVFYGLRDHVFDRLPLPKPLRPALGGLLTGLVGLVAPQAISLGYGWVQLGMLNKLSLTDYIAGTLGKILATGFTISSGGSGGVFGPAVVIGGFAGGAVGTGFSRLLPTWHLDTQSFVLVGMAAFFGGVAKAPIGAILMISEMTVGYGLLVPLMLTSAITFMLLPKRVSIYEQQVDGSVNSPAHLDRYVRHLAGALESSPRPQPYTD